MGLLTLILFIIGLVLLVVGAEWLVRGSSALAIAIGVSPLVVGLTVVAFGTSAPELAVGMRAGLMGDASEIDVALGNVLGSNIANILLILGLGAVFAPLVVRRQLVIFDLPLMLGISLLLLLLSLDGAIDQVEGLLLFLGIVAYTVWTIYQSRKDMALQREVVVHTLPGPSAGSSSLLVNVGYVVGGLAMLVIGSDWLVNGATAAARALGVSELIIGLTIVAVGTSLPEVATTVTAAIKGERDLAVGNAVGSNIFNILLVLGATSMLVPGGIPVSTQALGIDFPVMLAVSLICLPVCFTGWIISRWEGALFLVYYLAYILYMVLRAKADAATVDVFEAAMGTVIFLTAVGIGAHTIYALVFEQRPRSHA
jgi:cation:H+ antiporter